MFDIQHSNFECLISNIKLNLTFKSNVEYRISNSIQHSNFECRISNVEYRTSNQFLIAMLARMFIFLGLSFLAKPSCDSRTTFARQSHDVRENVVRRSMVINVRDFIGRTSCECLANVARMSRECETYAYDSCDSRTTFVRLSQICLNHPFGVTAM